MANPSTFTAIQKANYKSQQRGREKAIEKATKAGAERRGEPEFKRKMAAVKAREGLYEAVQRAQLKRIKEKYTERREKQEIKRAERKEWRENKKERAENSIVRGMVKQALGSKRLGKKQLHLIKKAKKVSVVVNVAPRRLPGERQEGDLVPSFKQVIEEDKRNFFFR